MILDFTVLLAGIRECNILRKVSVHDYEKCSRNYRDLSMQGTFVCRNLQILEFSSILLNQVPLQLIYLITEKGFIKYPVVTNHVLVFGKRQIKLDDLDEVLLENEWNHVNVMVFIDIDNLLCKMDSMIQT